MRGSKAYLLTSFIVSACSAGGSPNPYGRSANSDPTSSTVSSATPAPAPSLIDLTTGTLDVPSNGSAANLGTETICDGKDDNQNGIIDDVDKGQDGLCDCLNIGFLGDIASDAGSNTTAFQTWLESRSSVPVTRLDARAELTATALAPIQVLIVGNMTARISGNSPAYSAAELGALKAWIEVRGAGMMTLAGFTGTESHMLPTTQLLNPFGLGYDYSGRGAGVLGEGAPPMVITGIVAQHPTVENVKALGVYYGYPVTGDGQVIIRERSFDLAMAKELGKGRVFSFGDEWITQDKLWQPGALPTDLDVTQFWLNVISWLSPANECKVSIPKIIR